MTFATLYTVKPNPRSFAILAIAKLHGLELEVIYVDRSNKKSHDMLLQLNPLDQVPVLVAADGFVLTECMAIALYITSQSDTTTLLGGNRREYYTIIKWMSLANSDLQPAIGGVILPLLGMKLAVRKNSQDCLRAFHADCRILENQLQQSRYLVGGDQPTLADYFTVGTLVFGVMVFHSLLQAQYPRLWEWFNEVYEVPMFKDIVGELRLLDMPVPALEERQE